MSKKISRLVIPVFLLFIAFLSGPIEAMAEQPDLVVTNFWIWPKNPTSREWFDIKVRVYNKSDTALTKQTAIHIFVGGSNQPYTDSLNSLGAENTRDFNHRVFLDKPGKYVARVVVDPKNNIAESREDNNTRQFVFRVRKADSTEYLPDLSISTPRFSPEKPCTDDHIEFKASITNNGAVRSPASKAAIRVGGGGPVLFDVPPIMPGEYQSVSVTRLLSRAGNYVVTAYADYGNKIKEYNEQNNKKTQTFVVYDNCCPDLEISDNFVWIWPKNPKAGDKFDLRVRIFNRGLKKNLNHTTLKIYVGGSSTPYVFDVGPIEPGGERTYKQEISLGRPGKYTARAVVDSDNKVKECREDNNHGQVKFRVSK